MGVKRIWQNLQRLYQLVSGTSGEIVVTEGNGGRITLSLADPLTLPVLSKLVLDAQTSELAAGDEVPIDKPVVRLSATAAGGAVVQTAQPGISVTNAVDGQVLFILGQSDADTYQIRDESNYAGSKVRHHNGANVTFAAGYNAAYMYVASSGEWHQITYRADLAT